MLCGRHWFLVARTCMYLLMCACVHQYIICCSVCTLRLIISKATAVRTNQQWLRPVVESIRAKDGKLRLGWVGDWAAPDQAQTKIPPEEVKVSRYHTFFPTNTTSSLLQSSHPLVLLRSSLPKKWNVYLMLKRAESGWVVWLSICK